MCVCVCTHALQVEQIEAGSPGKLKVTALSSGGDEAYEDQFNTVSHSSNLNENVQWHAKVWAPIVNISVIVNS